MEGKLTSDSTIIPEHSQADIDLSDASLANTALRVACESGNLDEVRRLCCDLTIPTAHRVRFTIDAAVIHMGDNALLRETYFNDRVDIFRYLCSIPRFNITCADVLPRYEDGTVNLYGRLSRNYIHASNTKIIQYVCTNPQFGADNALLHAFVVPILFSAAYNGNVDTFRYLLSDERFGVTKGDVMNGDIALGITSHKNSFDIVKLLCDRFDINGHDLTALGCDSALGEAITCGHIDIVRYLCDSPRTPHAEVSYDTRFGVGAADMYRNDAILFSCAYDVTMARYLCEHPRFGIEAANQSNAVNRMLKSAQCLVNMYEEQLRMDDPVRHLRAMSAIDAVVDVATDVAAHRSSARKMLNCQRAIVQYITGRFGARIVKA